MSALAGEEVDQFDYFAWRKQAESFPCAPAKGLPKLGEKDKVLLRTIAAASDASETAAQLEQIVAEAIGADAHLVVVKVASWSNEEAVVASLVALRNRHGWTLKRMSRGLLNQTPFLRIGMRRVVGWHAEDRAAVESVPMILGPFTHFPRSRYCPAPIFEMSVCAEKTYKSDGKHRVNFLGIPMPKLSDAQREDLIATAKADTAAVNGGEDSRAKPGVTATFDIALEPLFN